MKRLPFLCAALFPAWAAAQIIIPIVDIDITSATELGTALSADELIVYDSTAKVNKKVQAGNLPGTGDTLPIVDTTAVVKGSADATKLVRIEADGITTGTTRVLTMRDADVDLSVAGTFPELVHTHSGLLLNVVEDTTPQLGGHLDINGQAIGDGTRELLTFIEDVSAVNQIEIENQAAGNGAIIRATGDDTNVDGHLATKGTGKWIVDTALDVQGNVTLSGTVDGRDVATDGTKLNGIESGATADQTTEEIEDIAGALVANATGTHTGIAITYEDGTADLDFEVDHDAATNFLATEHVAEATIDHGTIAGLADDDHTQYLQDVIDDTTPQLGGHLDVNGQVIGDGTRELLTFIEDGSAVNHVEIENQAAGNGAIIRATGDDTNVDGHLATKGTGQWIVDAALDVQGNVTLSGTVDARNIATDGTKLDGVETLADVTDATNVAAAGAVMDSDISGAEGVLRKTGAGSYEALKTNEASVAPTVNEDSGDGYAVGSRWIDTTADKEYICLDASAGAAVWTETTGGGGGGSVGEHTIWVPAYGMISRSSNGAAVGAIETSTNKVMANSLDFDSSADEFGQFTVTFPKSWNEGTITYRIHWSHPVTATNFGVALGFQCLALDDSDALDTAFGTAVLVTDTGGTTDDEYISSESASVTVANSPSEGDRVVCQVYRDVSDGSDDLAVDARLHGMTLFFTTDAENDD